MYYSIHNKIVIAVLLFLGIFLFFQIDLMYVPDSDFFAYLSEGRYLLQNIFTHAEYPQLWSIITALFEDTISIKYSGLRAMTAVNIIGLLGSLYMTWKISEKYYGLYGYLSFLLLGINVYSYIVHLQPVNNAGFSFIALCSIYLELVSKKYKSARLVAFLSCFIRLEGITLIFAFLLSDVFQKKKLTSYSLLSFILAGIFYTFSYLRNIPYLEEIAQKTSMIPNWEHLKLVFYKLPLGYSFDFFSHRFWYLVLIWVSIGLVILAIKKRELLFLSFYFVFFNTMHFVFPEAIDRYAYPVVWIVYFYGFWILFFSTKKMLNLRILLTLCMVALIVHSHIKIFSPALQFTSLQRDEGRFVSDFLNSYQYPSLVYKPSPWITAYYVDNKNISFPANSNLRFESCSKFITSNKEQDILSSLKNILFRLTKNICRVRVLENKYVSIYEAIKDNNNINYHHLVITDSYSEKANDYWDIKQGIQKYKDFETNDANNPCVEKLEEIKTNSSWANIYKVDRECYLNSKSLL